MGIVELVAVKGLEPFDFRWPEGTESFETGWAFQCADRAAGGHCAPRHRSAYGLRPARVHTVTWINGEVQVEGVEADDYPVSQALISRLRRPGRGFAKTPAEVPAGYERLRDR